MDSKSFRFADGNGVSPKLGTPLSMFKGTLVLTPNAPF